MFADDHSDYRESEATGPEAETEAGPGGPEVPEDLELDTEPELGPEGGREQPPPPGLPPQSTASSPGPAYWVLVVVMCIGIVGVGAAAVKFYATLLAADRALTTAANTLASLAGAERQRESLRATVEAIKSRRYDQVARGLQELAGKLAEAATAQPTAAPFQPPQSGLGPGPAAQGPTRELPPEAEQFFRRHPMLLRRIVALGREAARLRDEGVDVDPLRAIRDQVVQAAARGDEKQVRALLDKFAENLKKLGGRVPGVRGPRPPAPERLRKKAEALKKQLQQAARSGKDVREAVRLAQRADQAAARGDMRRAEELLDRASRAVKRAPRMKRRRPARRPTRRPRGPTQRPSPGRIIDVLIGMIRAEDADLADAYDAVTIADGALREKNQDQIHELLAKGIAALDRIAKRRKAVSEILRPPGPARGPAGPRRPGPPGARSVPGPEAGEMKPEPLPQRLIHFLERVREMPAEEFEATKHRLAAAVFAMFLPPSPKPQAPQADAEAVERVRAKLRVAAGPFLQRKLAGEDEEVAEIEDLFRQARTALYAGNVQEAEAHVDRALALLGLLEEPEAKGAEEAQPAGMAAPAAKSPGAGGDDTAASASRADQARPDSAEQPPPAAPPAGRAQTTSTAAEQAQPEE